MFFKVLGSLKNTDFTPTNGQNIELLESSRRGRSSRTLPSSWPQRCSHCCGRMVLTLTYIFSTNILHQSFFCELTVSINLRKIQMSVIKYRSCMQMWKTNNCYEKVEPGVHSAYEIYKVDAMYSVLRANVFFSLIFCTTTNNFKQKSFFYSLCVCVIF